MVHISVAVVVVAKLIYVELVEGEKFILVVHVADAKLIYVELVEVINN